MRPFDTLRTLLQHGMTLLEDAVGLSKHDLAALGFSPAEALRLGTLAELFFGPTASTRTQAEAREAARANRHSLDTLALIHRASRRVTDPRRRWGLVLDLCRAPGSYAKVDALAARLVDKLNADDPAPCPRTRLSVTADHAAREQTLHLTGPAHQITGVVSNLRGTAEQKAEQFFTKMRTGFAEPTVVTYATVPIDDLTTILNGDGPEIELVLTNGAVVTGAEYLNLKHADFLGLTLAVPEEGLVNTYRTERLANDKQRLMAKLENPVCPWPGCNKPADECEIHHLLEWLHGGDTNAVGLSTACGYHNGVNGHRGRGRLFRRGGEIWWDPPGTGPPRRNEHPAARLGAIRALKRRG
ncbi:HNH endonuclease signature motif containing protein [Corynebacterium guangdongense]|uniref:HNH nuclease domain-containing protein n=1 Tax=Corynebacterium guangdongense TaxID=1783348 RepID=A0ABU1ZWB6_9CORY|nr:HNH endonuclease signature motif containing protein [Corynebacterium guangdongense]MDR7329224.1 hypothetical protein [Corynebacterium guangdongense]WJZ17790.1 hypothetical protein CGUA_06075 [Corynebacterium guangdongense]